MLKNLAICISTFFLGTITKSQPCTATITPSGPTTFCSGGSVVLQANTGGNNWTQRQDFGGTARNAYVAFNIGNKGYLGTGFNGTTLTKDFWEYDPTNNTWSQKANFGGTARRYAVGFCIGTKGYIGTGYDGTYRKDFWEYDPANNTWLQKADFGGTARDLATGFAVGSKGYIGTGNDGSYKKDFWEYNPTNNTWLQKADFGGTARNAATGLFIGTMGYIGMGFDGSYKKDFWEYNPTNNSWSQKTDFGGSPRNAGTSFNIGSKGYVGMGFDGAYKKDMWEYDQNANTWTQKADFGGSARNAAISFSINGNGYVGLGFDGTYKKDFWVYSPALTYLWSNGATTPSITITTSGNYTVAVTNTATGCSITSDAVQVVVNNTMGIGSVTADKTTLCTNETTTLYANGVSGTNAIVTWWTMPGGNGTNLGTGAFLPNVGAGTYYARVTGSCNPAESSIVISSKTNVTITSATSALSAVCQGNTTTLFANGVSGTNATVNWWTGAGASGTNLGTGNSLPNATSGTYYAYVTGDCGSPAEAAVVVSEKENTAILSVSAAANPICINSTTTLNAVGVSGTNAIVNWWTGTGGTGTQIGSGNILLNAAPGTYYALVTGDCGVPAEASITINSLFENTITSVTAAANPICANTTTTLNAVGVAGSNTQITWWSATGGTGTFLGTGTILNNVGPGTYYTYVTGDCGSPAEASITVLSKSTSSSTVVASNCNSYTWHGTVYKASGNYTYTTTNAQGCDSIVTLQLTIFTTITSNFTKKDAACNTIATGSITINPTKGNPPFSYRIGTTGSFSSSNTFTGLAAGAYRVSILDVNGCTGLSTQITIIQQTTITGNFVKKDLTCNNVPNGSITITPTSGTPPFVYKYGTAGTYIPDSIATGLSQGEYRVYLQDVNGCNINTSLTINQPAPVNGTGVSTPTKCIGSSTGTITVTPTSGFSPFTYKLNVTGVYQTSNKFINLKAGVYAVYIKDKNNCVAVISVTVSQPTPLSATFTKTDAQCPGSATGSVIVNTIGGTGPYKYKLGTTGVFGTSNTFNNLKPGTYRVFINDANGCSGYSISVTIGTISSVCTATFARKTIDGIKSVNEEAGNITLNTNPAHHHFTLINAAELPALITVTDVTGRLIMPNLFSKKSKINFGEEILPGLYFIHIKTNNKSQTITAIKNQ